MQASIKIVVRVVQCSGGVATATPTARLFHLFIIKNANMQKPEIEETFDYTPRKFSWFDAGIILFCSIAVGYFIGVLLF